MVEDWARRCANAPRDVLAAAAGVHRPPAEVGVEPASAAVLVGLHARLILVLEDPLARVLLAERPSRDREQGGDEHEPGRPSGNDERSRQPAGGVPDHDEVVAGVGDRVERDVAVGRASE
jgi:hypothetical protein